MSDLKERVNARIEELKRSINDLSPVYNCQDIGETTRHLVRQDTDNLILEMKRLESWLYEEWACSADCDHEDFLKDHGDVVRPLGKKEKKHVFNWMSIITVDPGVRLRMGTGVWSQVFRVEELGGRTVYQGTSWDKAVQMLNEKREGRKVQ